MSLLLWVGTSLGLFFNLGQAASQVISVDFNRAAGEELIAPASPTYDGPDAYAAPAGNYWNRFEISGIMWNPPNSPAITNATSAPLKASDGTNETEITVSLSGFRGYFSGGNPSASFAPDLNNDYAWVLTAEAPGAFSIDHLVPGQKYTLFLYAQGAGWAGYGAAFTVTNTSASTNPQESTGADPNGFVEGQNYAIFQDVVADSSGHIGGLWQTSSLTEDPSEGDFNGLTIVSTSPEGTEVINVDFDISITIGNVSASPLCKLPGAVPGHTGSIWNDVRFDTTSGARAVSSSSLRLSDGVTVTRVTVSVTNCALYYTDDPSALAVPDLLNDYLYVTGLESPASFVIEQLVPGSTYDLYLYGCAAGYDTTGAGFLLDNPSSPTGYQDSSGANVVDLQSDVNYVVFANIVADAQGRISGIWGVSATSVDTTEGCFNGFQLVSSSGFPLAPEISLANPQFIGGQFSFDLPTSNGTLYSVEYTVDLNTGNWSELSSITGTGGVVTVTDNAALAAARYYRVLTR